MTDPADAAATLVEAALTPVGPSRTTVVLEVLARSDPATLPFAGWRALLLLGEVVDEQHDVVWRRRTASLRRRSFTAMAVVQHRAVDLSGALRAAGIDHVITGELALARRYPRPGDRPVHGVTIVTRSPRRRVHRILTAAGVRSDRLGRRSLRADLGGLTLLVHDGWPGAAREPLAPDPDPPGSPHLPLAAPPAEARRILRPPTDPDAPAHLLDLAALEGTLPD